MPDRVSTDANATQSLPRRRRDWVRSLWRRATTAGAWRIWSAPAALGLAVIVQLFVLGWMASKIYFIWGDDYDFLLLRGTVDGVDRGLLAPHDDHWSTGTILIYRLIFEFVGLRHYLPYGMMPILFHLTLIVVMYLVMRRLGVGRWYAAIPCIVLAFGGMGSGAILWSTTMGTVGALLLGFVAVDVLIRRPDGKGVARAWIILVVALTMSGAGITAVFFTTVFTWLRDGFRRAAQVVLLPAGVFLAWFVIYGRGGVKPALTDAWQYTNVPKLIWTGLSDQLGRLVPLPAAGTFLLIILVAAAFLSDVPRAQRNLAIAGCATAIFQVTLAGVSRPLFGQEDFSGSRYAYYTMVFLMPSLSVLLAHLAGKLGTARWAAAGMAAWLFIGMGIHGEGLFHQEQLARTFVSGGSPAILRGIVAAAKVGSPVLTPSGPSAVLDSRFRGDLIARKGMWRQVPGGEATPAERVQAEGIHFVGVSGDKPLSLPFGGSMTLTSGWTQVTAKKGCSHYDATMAGAVLSLESGAAGVQVGIMGPADSVATTVERAEDVSSGRTWPVTPGKTSFVGTTAKHATLNVSVSVPGKYLVCP